MVRSCFLAIMLCSSLTPAAVAAGINELTVADHRLLFDRFQPDLTGMAAALPDARILFALPSWLSGSLPDLEQIVRLNISELIAPNLRGLLQAEPDARERDDVRDLLK